MSTIKAIFDIEAQTVTATKILEADISTEQDLLTVELSVTDNSASMIKHLTCGFILYDSEGIKITEFLFPPAGTVSSLDGAISDSFEINYNTRFVLNCWAQNLGQRFEKDITFSSPIPLQPYASWTWNGATAWVPPTPMPTNKKGANYAWSEKLKKWIELVPPLHQYDDIL
jgi:hypothetical protein